jgi:hypothetical protein
MNSFGRVKDFVEWACNQLDMPPWDVNPVGPDSLRVSGDAWSLVIRFEEVPHGIPDREVIALVKQRFEAASE